MKILEEHLVIRNNEIFKVYLMGDYDNLKYYIQNSDNSISEITPDAFIEYDNNFTKKVEVKPKSTIGYTLINDWFINLPSEIEVSTRLLSHLLEMEKVNEKWKYIENINAAELRRKRGVGELTYQEFLNLKESGYI